MWSLCHNEYASRQCRHLRMQLTSNIKIAFDINICYIFCYLHTYIYNTQSSSSIAKIEGFPNEIFYFFYAIVCVLSACCNGKLRKKIWWVFWQKFVWISTGPVKSLELEISSHSSELLRRVRVLKHKYHPHFNRRDN